MKTKAIFLNLLFLVMYMPQRHRKQTTITFLTTKGRKKNTPWVYMETSEESTIWQ